MRERECIQGNIVEGIRKVDVSYRELPSTQRSEEDVCGTEEENIEQEQEYYRQEEETPHRTELKQKTGNIERLAD